MIERGYSSGQDAVTECFEQIASRFDMYLSRLHKKNSQTHRGIAIFDKSSTGKSHSIIGTRIGGVLKSVL
ncbi:hypothetical protein [Kingella negevensis]|uniref:hypothetical protein n=1 Tax=Kingella negevensis TaxID=1522312 RepID=UPI000693A4DD|nr:hypothetical protein [Kingella negevensis]MDK4688424.1 hypothetical protein [Kingella negevensis]WII90318.1 hypothetical protein QEO93_07530 [Kingella negevensis]